MHEQISAANLGAYKAETFKAVAILASFDWRNVTGKNFITPVKNQGWCGSCVDFGATATEMAMMKTPGIATASGTRTAFAKGGG